MENKNIVLLRHHPMDVKFTNQFYDTIFISTGHASVLKMLLEGDIEIIDDKIIDHIGILM